MLTVTSLSAVFALIVAQPTSLKFDFNSAFLIFVQIQMSAAAETETTADSKEAAFAQPCPQCNKAPEQPLDVHIRDFCPMTEIRCPFFKHGCSVKTGSGGVMKRRDLNEHVEESAIQHICL